MTAKVQTIRFKDDLGNDFPDWETAPLGAVADIKLGKMLDKEKQTAGCLLPYLNNISLRWNYVDTSNLPQMYFRDHELERFGLRAGDVVVCEGGEPGRSAVWDGRLPDLKFQKAIHRVRFKESFEPCLLVLYLEKIAGTAKFEMLFTGGGIKHLTKETFSRLTVPVITLPEQRKIADFLTAVDGRIGQLIQKKALLEDYKKGVMQQLFTQAIRFKGDHGNDFPEWEEKKLGEIATFTKGSGISKAEVHEDGVTPCIRYGELYTHYSELIVEVKSRTNVEPKNLVMSQRNDVIIPASGETHIDIATASCVMEAGIALGGDLNIIRAKTNGVFLAYYLNNAMKHGIARMAQGSSVIHLYPAQLKLLKLTVPSVPEQTKIADFLCALDRKIESVTTQITETQTFKRGLLQQMFV